MAFYEDRTGDLTLLETSIALKSNFNTNPNDDFIPLATKKPKNKQKQSRRNKSLDTKKEQEEHELAVMMDFVQNSDPFYGSFTQLAQLTLDDSSSEVAENQFELLKEHDDAVDVDSEFSAVFDDSIDADSVDVDSVDIDVSSTSDFLLELDSELDLSDDQELLRENFSGHKSAWDDDADATDIRREQRLRRKIRAIMDGSFSESEVLEHEEASPNSKSARKKQAKKEKKLKKQLRKTQAEIRSKHANNLDKSIRSLAPKEGILTFLKQVNRQIHDFVIGAKDPSTILPPMPGFVRRVVCELCKSYYVLPKTRGSGKKKLVVVFRTGLSQIPENWKHLPAALESRHDMKPSAYYKNKSKKQSQSTREKKPGRKGAPDMLGQPKVGDVIGSHLQPLDEENKGRRMLEAMGWKQGDSLGSTNTGATDPLKVTVRSKRAGLGGI